MPTKNNWYNFYRAPFSLSLSLLHIFVFSLFLALLDLNYSKTLLYYEYVNNFIYVIINVW